MTATVGRAVHFHPPAGDPGPLHGTVCAVAVAHSGPGQVDVVNLAVLSADGHSRPELSVPFAETPTPGHWSWPPRN